MAKLLEIHPDNPQPRRIQQAVDIIHKGGVIAYPTDSSYAFGCHIGDSKALERIRQIRRVSDDHNFTLVCADLSEVSRYARVSNDQYRLLKAHTPGAYTFILHATREVPRRLQHPKKKTIGLRIPDHRIALALLSELGEPLMSSTLILPGSELPLNDADDILEALDHQLDLVIDGGACDIQPTSVISLLDGAPVIEREGKGEITHFL